MLGNNYGYKTVGVLSDTHLSDIKQCAELADRLLAGPFCNIDAIFHAGDHVCEELESCFYPTPWISVRGNMDHHLTAIPQYRILSVNNFKVGLIHGWGNPEGIEERILSAFAGQSLDVIVYGHSHIPACHKVAGTLMFNSGSPTDKRNAPMHTVGLLSFSDVVRGSHIEFEF